MVISCNPDPDHKIKELISWYLDDEGYPIPERDGVIRWFIRRDGEFIWGESEQELIEKYWDGKDEKRKPKPLSFSFISATIKRIVASCSNACRITSLIAGKSDRVMSKIISSQA